MRKKLHSFPPLTGCICKGKGERKTVQRMTIDEFHHRVTHGFYQKEVQEIYNLRWSGMVEESHKVEMQLPVFYPGIDADNNMNGIAVVTMRHTSPFIATEALSHIRQWKFVKMYFTNCRGNIVIFIWLGNDIKTEEEFIQRRSETLQLMRMALRNVFFRTNKRVKRGVWVSHDSYAFCRVDEELEAL